jgi:hypothetical protein
VRRGEEPLPGPVLGKVDCDASGVTGDASGQVDQVPAGGGRRAVAVARALAGPRALRDRCLASRAGWWSTVACPRF